MTRPKADNTILEYAETAEIIKELVSRKNERLIVINVKGITNDLHQSDDLPSPAVFTHLAAMVTLYLEFLASRPQLP